MSGSRSPKPKDRLAESFEACLAQATALKTLGTAAFRTAHYEHAAKHYTEAVLYLGTQSVLLNDCSPRQFKAYVSLRVSLLLNSAIAAIKAAQQVQRASLKEELGRTAIEHCNQVLEPVDSPQLGTLESFRELSDADRAKAFYRRALAQSLIEDDEASVKDLEEAVHLAPDDTTIRKELESVRLRIQKTSAARLTIPGTVTDPDAIMFEDIVRFILNRLALHQKLHYSESETEPRPLFVGIQGAQGIGKTTITEKIAEKLRANPYNLNLITLSLDDLYLTRSDQQVLEQSNPKNVLLSGRGVAGTHDLPLAIQLFQTLESINKSLPLPEISIPRYDKLAFNGLGDREAQFDAVNFPNRGRLNLIILEGWMVGFKPFEKKSQLEEIVLGMAKMASVDLNKKNLYKNQITEIPSSIRTYLAGLQQVNTLLKPYQKELWEKLDIIVQLQPTSYDFVRPWRLEAEKKMMARTGRQGMKIEQIDSFLERYIPHYEMYGHRVSIRPNSPTPFNAMEITVNKDRSPIKIVMTSDAELSKRAIV